MEAPHDELAAMRTKKSKESTAACMVLPVKVLLWDGLPWLHTGTPVGQRFDEHRAKRSSFHEQSRSGAGLLRARLVLSLLVFSGLLFNCPIALASSESAMYFAHSDHLGTPRQITDEAGTVVWTADYEPFGQVSLRRAAVSNAVRFPGQYSDQETWLHYNYLRDYDPLTGRYIQSDPVGLDGGINTYTYVLNRPINWTDPTGLKPYSFKAKIGGGIGYVVIGGGIFLAEVTDMESGEVCSYQVRCFGAGAGLPEISVTSRPVVFDDGSSCSDCDEFEGTGYMGGVSAVLGAGITIGGGIKFPNGPLVPGDYLDWNYGGIRIGVSHNICYFRFQSKK